MASENAKTESVCKKPVIVGTGLLVLDVVMKENVKENPRCFAGGTCGNVLTAMSYLGWKALPIGRLAPGPVAEHLLDDLKKWKVSTKLISIEIGGSSPVIFEKITRSMSGEPHHTFSWRCPVCGAYLPGYKPVLASVAQELRERLPDADVFFFDRVSRGALILAEEYAKMGAVVVFEPCGIGAAELFREAWCLAHVVKYSHERLSDIAEFGMTQHERDGVLLEIETLGADGLRYRSRLGRSRTRGWETTKAIAAELVKDTAGSGDWCSAGILEQIGRGGLAQMKATSRNELLAAIRYGQALATWNCGFEGARGGMYEVKKSEFQQQVAHILAGGDSLPYVREPRFSSEDRFLGRICPACTEANGVSKTAGVRHGTCA